jgi:hypothetical protein
LPLLDRVLPGVPVTVTDEIGYVYETDSTGEYKRTTGLIQKLEDAEITESTKLTPREKSIALLKYDPNFYINKTVYQLFGDEVYEGIVRYVDKDTETGRTFWNVLYSDGKGGDLWDDEMVKYCIDKVDGCTPGIKIIKTDHPLAIAKANSAAAADSVIREVPESFMNSESKGGDSFKIIDDIPYLIDPVICKERLIEHDYYYTAHDDTFKDVCAATKLDKAQWPMYYQWVNEKFMRGELFLARNDDDSYVYPEGIGFTNPFQKGVGRSKPRPLPNDVRFPLPKGPLWEEMLRRHSKYSNDLNLEHQNAKQENYLLHAAAVQAIIDTEKIRHFETEDYVYARIANAYEAEVKHKINPDHVIPPKNFEEAMSRENWDDWMYVTSKEMDGLEEMNVFSIEEYTINELRRMGIKHAPMPLGLIYDVKQTPAGDWDKDKARLVMRGHRWNMRKSFGFDHTYETYAATPDLSTTRIMQALMVLYGWKPLAFDIKMAYINADIPLEEQVPVQFEKSMRKYDKNGNELFRILRKCLYGSPTATRRFTQMRDAWMLEYFNKDGWSCKQIRCDRSLFKFVSPEGNVSLATVHSDDVDMINQVSKDGVTIAEAFNLKFGGDDDGIKMCDPSFMLGVQRKTRYDEKEDVYYHELTQSGCITDLYKEFESEMPKKTATTPMPEKTFLSMFTPEGDRREQSDEITAEIKGKGYMHIVGTLLWLSRNCYPEISQGLSQLCSVMSKPSQEAYDAALHMISYVYGQRDRGIQFNSKGNWDLLTLYDASNKGDYGDSKVSAGHVVMLAGGPISWSSKKAQHSGASSSHNEYMAAFHAAKETKWIRDLLMELDLPGHDWSKPAIMLGDNDQATRWAVHGMVTTANKSVRMNYHWVQEAVEDGFVDMRRVPTADNTSDIFTKTLGEVDITRLRPGLTGYGPLPPVPDAMPT